jgi:hypothetical protein
MKLVWLTSFFFVLASFLFFFKNARGLNTQIIRTDRWTPHTRNLRALDPTL